EVLIHLSFAGSAFKFAGIEGKHGFEAEMTFPNEDGARDYAIDRVEEREGALLKLKRTDVPDQREVFETKGSAQPDSAKLTVDGVGIGKGETLAGNGDAYLLLGNRQLQLQL